MMWWSPTGAWATPAAATLSWPPANMSDTPVVVISGYVNEAFQAADPLADYYLEKPVNPEELISVVNDLVKPGPAQA